MTLSENIEKSLFSAIEHRFDVTAVSCEKYASLKWPKLLSLMRIHTASYNANGYGRLTVMRSKAMGAVSMLTCTLTPTEGAGVPLLLIEVMETKEKSTLFIEYFDCTKNGIDPLPYEEISSKYKDLTDYPEPSVWYAQDRMKASLIKYAQGNETAKLVEMADNAFNVYFAHAISETKDPDNVDGLTAFSVKMCENGNTYKPMLEKMIGKEDTVHFFRDVFIPV